MEETDHFMLRPLYPCGSSPPSPSVPTGQDVGKIPEQVWIDALEKINTSCPCQEPNRDSLVVQPVAYSVYRLSYSK
jgi:hypothetical protein